MLDLIGDWVGSNFGTHPGNVLVKIERSIEPDSVNLKIFLNSGGVSYGATSEGIQSINSEVPLRVQLPNSGSDVVSGVITITAASSINMDARWQIGDSVAGVLRLNRAVDSVTSNVGHENRVADEIVGADILIGPTTIFRSELQNLLKKIRSLFRNQSNLTVVLSTDLYGKERIAQLDNQFLDEPGLPRILSNLEISAVDKTSPIHNSVLITLNEIGTGKLSVQSSDRVWTHGSKESVRVMLQPNRSRLMDLIKNYGLNMNGLILLVAITFLPELSILNRAILLILTMIFITAIFLLHKNQTKHQVWTDATVRSGWITDRKVLKLTALVGVASVVVAIVGIWLSKTQ
jgi:hypothetical protein